MIDIKCINPIEYKGRIIRISITNLDRYITEFINERKKDIDFAVDVDENYKKFPILLNEILNKKYE